MGLINKVDMVCLSPVARECPKGSLVVFPSALL